VNKELSNNFYNIPEDVINKINETLGKVGSSWVDGRQRAENLLSTKRVSYGQLKRIIHDLKEIDKVNDRTKYDLCGGELMEKWANTFLNGERKMVKDKKMVSHNINNNTGMNGMRKNPFLKKHETNRRTTKTSTLIKKCIRF